MNLKIAQNVIKKYAVVKLLYISKDHMVVYLQARTSLEMDGTLNIFLSSNVKGISYAQKLKLKM
jgi:hypothetical protein